MIPIWAKVILSLMVGGMAMTVVGNVTDCRFLEKWGLYLASAGWVAGVLAFVVFVWSAL